MNNSPATTFRRIAIIPIYNEGVMAEALLVILAKMVDYVITIDDGSTDSTWELIVSAAQRHPNIIPLRLPRNQGKGYALKYGFYSVKALYEKGTLSPKDVVFTLDSDGQHNPDYMNTLLQSLNEGKAEIIISRRSFTAYPFIRRMGNRFLNYLSCFLSGAHYFDSESGFRCMRVDTLLKILTYYSGLYYSDSQEITVIAGRTGLRVNNEIICSISYFRIGGARYREGFVIMFMGIVALIKVLLKKRAFDERLFKSIQSQKVFQSLTDPSDFSHPPFAKTATNYPVAGVPLKVLLLYPPGPLCIREDRCQVLLRGMVAATLRPPVDLAAIAATLPPSAIKLLRDYPAEKKTVRDLAKEVKQFQPDFCIVHTSYASLREDLFACNIIKAIVPSTCIIAKGPVFLEYAEGLLKDYPCLDIAIRGEAELSIAEIIKGRPLDTIPGVAFRLNGEIIQHQKKAFGSDIDSLPLPDRTLINNALYCDPLSGESQTVIHVQRGCPFGCSFCLVESISGKVVRYRSIVSAIKEIEECLFRHKIRRFFFKADSFTLDREWVRGLCEQIIEKKLGIYWLANSRVDHLDESLLYLMKRSGCQGLALGIESGSQETMDRVKKNITCQDTKHAVELCKKAGIRVMAMYIIGWPWDNEKAIKDTIRFAQELNTTIAEFNFFVPFPGIPAFDEYARGKVPHTYNFPYNYSTNPFPGRFLNSRQLIQLRQRAYLKYYFRLKYIRENILLQLKSWQEFRKCLGYGLTKLKEVFR